MGLVLAAAVALLPTFALRFVSGPGLLWVSYCWLLALLAVGGLWLAAVGELWLALVCLWFLCRWRDRSLLASLVRWIAVGASWYLFLQVPRRAWPWIALVWVLLQCAQSLLVLVKAIRLRPLRQPGWSPSPVMTALALALVTPFAGWAAWPFLGVGLLITSSWIAFLGVGAGLLWLYPGTWLYGAAGALTAGSLLWFSRWQQAHGYRPWMDWTPRGDSLDGITSRWGGWLGLYLLLWREPAWWWGRGPDTTEAGLLEVSSRSNVETPLGDACNELVQLTVEYGVLGLGIAVAFVWRVAPHLHLGDPWAAAWVVGCVLSMAHWPLRYPPTGLMFLAISAKVVQ